MRMGWDSKSSNCTILEEANLVHDRYHTPNLGGGACVDAII
jgi:hypothetical protein